MNLSTKTTRQATSRTDRQPQWNVVVKRSPQATTYARIQKRTIDLVVAITASIFLLPILAVLYLIVRMGGNPVFYGQTRLGRGGAQFKAWKFRTMVVNADEILCDYLAKHPEFKQEWERDHKLKKDPRVTRIGKFLRMTSLDELPQLWNIIKGDMSLVGPRPIVRAEVPKYGDVFHDYKQVMPGLTGLWQVSGRNNTTYEERVALDRYYAQNWTLARDLRILFKTVKVVLLRDGAF